MLDLARLDRIRLSAAPRGQRFVAYVMLMPNYRLPPRVRIDFEGYDRVPAEPVIFAMNHTDRYNYWPFQLEHWQRADRFTATWVKGKYYESELVGTFMELTNNIPTVSRGYLITKDYLHTLGRRPTDAEYQATRAWVNAVAHGESPDPPPEVPERLRTERRTILGYHFYPHRETYAEAVDQVYRLMMRRFVELNEEAAQLGLDLLIFPQGTRNKRLLAGRPGLSQIAMHLERPVVPVGCNGSDSVYPTGSPIARGGHIVYRFGDPIRREDAVAWVDRGDFEPFTAEAERDHAGALQAYVDQVMDRIDPLLDPEYRFDPEDDDNAVAGSHRFV